MLPPTAHRLALLPLVLLAACASSPQTPTVSPDVPPPPAASPAPVTPLLANAAAPGSAAPPTPTEVVIDSSRETVRSTAVWVARSIDGWFGNRPFEAGGKVSNGQLDLSVLKREGETTNVGLRINARFALPNIDKLSYVFVGRDDEREVVADTPGALARRDRLLATSSRERSFFAGLGRSLDDAIDFKIGVRGAFKIYAQARAQQVWQLGEGDAVEARQTFFWTVADRLGSTSTVSYGHEFSPSLTLRWHNTATITQELPKFVWASSLGGYQDFGMQRLLSLEALVNGQQGSGVDALDYGVQARWEQPVYQSWLIGGIAVGHFWPRPDAQTARHAAWALGLNLKMRF